MDLEAYWEKRHFDATPEPRGEVEEAGRQLLFVVQMHDASHLHFDFRLEMGGVLKSWAVPKGPSLNPAEKRLAVEVEDHPKAYGRFEGVIPEPQYGAGTVLLWDRGHWLPDGEPLEAYRKGHIRFSLVGERLKGKWSLLRMHESSGKRANWLLVKTRDRYTSSLPLADKESATSVVSGLTLREMAARVGRVKHHVQEESGVNPEPDEDMKAQGSVLIAGVLLSHPARMVYPDDGYSKLAVARYYDDMAGRMLSSLSRRPLSILRCPDGISKTCFFQKHMAGAMPDFLKTVLVQESDKKACYMLANDSRSMLGLVQMGVIEFHTWGARRDRLDRPDCMIFDLDPGPGVLWSDVCQGAQLIRALLHELELPAYLKTSGGKGLHIEVPLLRVHEWQEVKDFSHRVALHMQDEWPALFVASMSKEKRKFRIFVDYLRNTRGATTVAAYSLRARVGAPIATPLYWEELADVPSASAFTLRNIHDRLTRLRQEPWGDYEVVRTRIRKAAREALHRKGGRS